jgi:hypothetical protein
MTPCPESPGSHIIIRFSSPARRPTANRLGSPFVKKKFADQKDAEQLNISVPRSLIEVLRPISQQVDLEFYKVLLVGLDAFVRDNRHTITPELYEAYRRLRNSL